MNAWEEIKRTPNYKYAEKEFKKLPMVERIKLYSKVYYPERDVESLTVSDKIDVLLKMPDTIEFLSCYLDYREEKVLKMLYRGFSYQEVCDVMGFNSRSSVSTIVNNIRDKFMILLRELTSDKDDQTEELVLEEIIIMEVENNANNERRPE